MTVGLIVIIVMVQLVPHRGEGEDPLRVHRHRLVEEERTEHHSHVVVEVGTDRQVGNNRDAELGEVASRTWSRLD